MKQQEFELLALPWWQNPWYWAFLLAAFIALMAISLFVWWRWYRARYRALTPEEQLLQDLTALEKAPFVTAQEQKAVCSQFILACKKYARLRFNCAVDHLSDPEFVQALRNTACSQALVDGIAALLDVVTQLKFSPWCSKSEIFLSQLAHNRQIVASLASSSEK